MDCVRFVGFIFDRLFLINVDFCDGIKLLGLRWGLYIKFCKLCVIWNGSVREFINS